MSLFRKNLNNIIIISSVTASSILLSACNSDMFNFELDIGQGEIPAVTNDAGLDASLVIAANDTDITCGDHTANRQALFGDTHVHTVYSLDAYTQDVRLTPADAYDFAKGVEVGLPPYNTDGSPQNTYQLNMPLDFAMVSDHAEFFGDRALCTNPVTKAYGHPSCILYRAQNASALVLFNLALAGAPDKATRQSFCGILNDGAFCEEHAITLWQQTQIDANQAHDPCNFTAFVGYEWSGNPSVESGGTGGLSTVQNLHRNVIFANSEVPERPVDYFQQGYPEGLWANLTKDCLNTGTGPITGDDCNVLTIPHNSNVSNGLMFEQQDRYELPIDASYAAKRALFEPIIEVIQHKGSSECYAGGSDEQCGDFEYLPWGHLAGNVDSFLVADVAPKETSFVRDALKEGLALQESLGVNPFKYGMIGSTDTHLGTPGLVDEVNYPGHGGSAGLSTGASFTDEPFYGPGGLAVVWAEQNTRASIFAAMQRKEVYATSGPRHELRFFGGWNYNPATDCSGDIPTNGYAGGVPMGDDMPAYPGSGNPKFILSALKDALGTDLQYTQIVKAWVDGGGVRHEQVFDVGGDKNNGASVNMSNCSTVGAGVSTVCTVWEDTSFDSTQNALYYARALENPTCRWTSHQAVAEGVDCNVPATIPDGMAKFCDGTLSKTVQERSWSSPIWYTAP